MKTNRSTLQAIDAALDTIEVEGAYKLYTPAHNTRLTYIYGTGTGGTPAHEFAALVVVRAGLMGRRDLAEEWRTIGKTLIHERLNND